MKCVNECRGGGLRKGRAERAARVHDSPGVHPYSRRAVPTCDMTEFVNRRALLRHQEQQQETQRFQHMFHSIDRHSPGP